MKRKNKGVEYDELAMNKKLVRSMYLKLLEISKPIDYNDLQFSAEIRQLDASDAIKEFNKIVKDTQGYVKV